MITRCIDKDLELRLYRVEDAPQLFDLIDRNRDHLRPWFEMVEQTRERADTAKWIQRMIDRQAEEPRGWSGVYERGRLVGSVGVTIIDHRHELAEIGYWLSADTCGRGIATRACTALLRYLFEEVHVHRVGLHAAATNVPSIALARRLGFVQEGAIRESSLFEGQRRDMLLFGLLAAEWKRCTRLRHDLDNRGGR